jgi:hypothetical protein
MNVTVFCECLRGEFTEEKIPNVTVSCEFVGKGNV